MKAIAMPRPLYEYVVERFAQDERRLLQKMWPAAERAGLRPIMISEEQAKFVRLLVRVHGSRRALDVGTLFGYSAANLALAMGPSGRVVSLEADPMAAKVARDNLRKLKLSGRVKIQEGAALESMGKLRSGSFDVVLIDADKPNYSNYLKQALRLLRDGGLVMVDNAFAFGEILDEHAAGEVATIRAFNDELSRHPKIESVIVPVGDGLAVGVVAKRARRRHHSRTT